MNTIAFKMLLNEGQKQAYIERHDEIWPELKRILKEAGVSDYAIFLDEETNILFAVQKVAKDGDTKHLANNEVVKKWWDYMADIMEVNPDNSPVVKELEQVFYME